MREWRWWKAAEVRRLNSLRGGGIYSSSLRSAPFRSSSPEESPAQSARPVLRRLLDSQSSFRSFSPLINWEGSSIHAYMLLFFKLIFKICRIWFFLDTYYSQEQLFYCWFICVNFLKYSFIVKVSVFLFGVISDAMSFIRVYRGSESETDCSNIKNLLNRQFSK